MPSNLLATLYSYPRPPPRRRTKPLQILCVGLPRSGTESLSLALTHLGYTTYHGWDIVFDDPPYTEQWARLAERKYSNPHPHHNKPTQITTTEFDALLGHCDAVINTAAALFNPEIITAYPDAKIILNTRKDVDAWHRSALKTLAEEGADQWSLWFLRLWTADMYWLWRLYCTFGYPGLFRGRTTREGLERNGKRVYMEHGEMVRGMVKEEGRLLEWNVEDGWGGCFLGKEVPDVPFPKANDPAAFRQHMQDLVRPRVMRSLRNFALCVASVGAVGLRLFGGEWEEREWE
ncbi:hypothetical protein BO94DRAFT_555458 [Aspergillus sclerotioniger CBS 115572]|uniref:NAD dependent epimerase/dehydratase n=1 Tax=Aspergillus sclerotioniger CBS 115572 TaxID=1450535 RepID=A0A317X3W4_9EURO|nr:hypothetical protein BO94DRAFT_555458 [Aspergillus sclerotioniger CBS 115572]PWY91648.1 hypothetical protein BO94DRAFT_555458 [Aspergillus sclerotioniger CBS 115572]